jgi:hypothetical protein
MTKNVTKLLWLLIVSVTVSSCAYYPPVKPMTMSCVVKDNGCQCSNPEGNKVISLEMNQCVGFIAMPVEDSRVLDEYILNIEKTINGM